MSVAVETAPVRIEHTWTVADEVLSRKWWFLSIAILFFALYAPNFAKLWSDWGADENYSHGYLVPVIFAWMLWTRRNELLKQANEGSVWGIVIVGLGLFQLLAGRLGAENFVAHTSMLVVLSGMTIYLFGKSVFKLVAFPIGWLLLMIPIPSIIFYSITFPLQMIASSMASRGLDLLQIPNLREGNVIFLSNYSMGVVEACSGIRSLISLLAVAVMLGFVKEMKVWARIALAIAAVPIALLINALRIAGTGIAGNYLGPQYAEGFFHTFSGWILFVLAMVLLLAVAAILGRVSGEDGKAVSVGA